MCEEKKKLQGWDSSYLNKKDILNLSRKLHLVESVSIVNKLHTFCSRSKINDLTVLYPIVNFNEGYFENTKNDNVVLFLGYAPNNGPHLGSALHMHACKSFVNLKQFTNSKLVLSFNVYEAINVRKVDEKEVTKNIDLFKELAEKFGLRNIEIETRTESEILAFKSKIEEAAKDINQESIFIEKLPVEKYQALLIQASASLWRQALDKELKIIRFYGIEEYARAEFINEVAKRLGLPGVLNFFTSHFPSLTSGIKMSKSKANETIFYGDNITEVARKIKECEERDPEQFDEFYDKIQHYFDRKQFKKVVNEDVLPENKSDFLIHLLSKGVYTFRFQCQ